MGSQIILEVQNFFSTGNLPRKINSTHIRLIPKILSPKKVAEYRPIALCTVFYKIISKLLSKHLQPVLQTIVAENQSAFVPNRAITDNVLITHEVLHYLKTSGAEKTCYMAVQTDMSKAYDRLEWNFIRLVLERLGFHHKWINWLMQCICTVSYSFLLNGSAQGLVTPSRGIRQGDPLSPYLFILCSEVLSGLCLNAQSQGTLPGIRVALGSPRVNHLLFADDTMFFCRSDQKSCQELMLILRKYEEASGQKINTEKSAITFSRKISEEARTLTKQILNIQKEGGLGKYLGLPELFGRKKKDLFNLIIDRIRQRALSWSSKFLSCAGKATLLQSVLASMPTYTMSCFKLPGSLCKRIQSALTRFWWDGAEEKHKMAWISWSKLTLSKKDGGLGFRDIKNFNDALLAKISWRILTKPSCLLARVLLGKYCTADTFLTCKTPSSSSHGWRGICLGRDLLKTSLGRAIGDGKSTLIWEDPWLSFSTPLQPMGPPTLQSQGMMVSQLLCPENLTWQREKIHQLLPSYEDTILELNPSKLGAQDKFVWLPSKTGEYSAKSGYHIANAQNRETTLRLCNLQGFNWYTEIWLLKTAPKIRFFMWKALKNAIPIGENLKFRGINITAICPHCGLEETVTHLLFLCSFAKQVWEAAPFKQIPLFGQNNSLRTIIENSKTLTCLPPTGLGSVPLFPWLLWTLWTSRNKLIFESRQVTAGEAISQAIVQAKEWSVAQEFQIPSPPPKKSIPRPILNMDTIRGFSDASWRDTTHEAGFGWILIDQLTNHEIQGSATASHISSALTAEATALLLAIKHAIDLNFKNISFASDSQTLIKAINGGAHPVELHGILHDVLNLSSFFSNVSFSFVNREHNRRADLIAKSTLAELDLYRPNLI